jgi:hypothetical protein
VPEQLYPNHRLFALARDHSSSNIDHHQTTTIDRQTITTTTTVAPSAQEELERTTQQEQGLITRPTITTFWSDFTLEIRR